jgi:hypothetical protein
MEGTVISDAVNLASRIEGMTKFYGVPLLISEHTFHSLSNANQHLIHLIDKVKVKGKSEPVTVFGVFDGMAPESQRQKRLTRTQFERAVVLYQLQRFKAAQLLFEDCYKQCPEDAAAALYIKRCEHYIQVGWDETWDGAMQLEHT